MKLLTKEIERKLERFPIYSQDGKGRAAQVVFKVFSPVGVATWLITEGERQEGGDWLFFGWVKVFNEWEAGYFTLSDLESVRVFGGLLGLERDGHASGTVEELMR